MDIRVYRISTCHWCDKVEAFLKKYGIVFKSVVIDVMSGDEQEKALAEAYKLSKQRSFPVTYIDGTCVIGFHESRLRHLLKLPAKKEGHEKTTFESAEGEVYELPEGINPETIDKMREWLEREAKSHSYTINPDKRIVEEILIGLARNEKRYGYKACPCRLAVGKYQLDCDIICPCSYCFFDVEKYGRCYCTLFVSDRFIAGDPALPHYVPDSRERGEIAGVEAVKSEPPAPTTCLSTILFKTHSKVVGFMQDGAHKNTAREGFLNLAKSLGIDVPAIQWGEERALGNGIIDNTKVLIKLKHYADAYTYQITCNATDIQGVNGEKLFQKINYLEQKNKLFECSIAIPKGIDIQEDLKRLSREKKYMSYIYNRYQIVTGFEGEGMGKDIFILASDDSVSDRVVEEIVTLEINYHLLSIEQQRYILAEDKMNYLDSTVIARLGTISMNLSRSQPEELKGWLHGLSNNFGEVSGLAGELRHRMNYTTMKGDTIRKIFKDWEEKSAALQYPLLSQYFLEIAENLCNQYQRLFIQIDGIRREVIDLISMLRTKIDLMVQEQSLELQRSMDETTRTQMIMQHTVEGLSVIILSYYTIHLAGFIFESLEAGHIIHSTVIVKAVFIPIAIGISWYLTFRARRLIRKHTKSSRSNRD